MMYESGLIESKWIYNTASSAGVGLGKLIVSGGMFVLNDPQGKPHRFAYKGVGASIFDGKLLPKRLQLPSIPLPKSIMRNGNLNATGASTSFDGGGQILYSGRHEPNPEDFEGFTLYGEASVGVLVGYGVSLFMTGMRKTMIAPFMLAPSIFSDYLFTSSAPVIALYGMNEGLIDAAGLGLMIGSISYNGPEAE